MSVIHQPSHFCMCICLAFVLVLVCAYLTSVNQALGTTHFFMPKEGSVVFQAVLSELGNTPPPLPPCMIPHFTINTCSIMTGPRAVYGQFSLTHPSDYKFAMTFLFYILCCSPPSEWPGGGGYSGIQRIGMTVGNPRKLP